MKAVVILGASGDQRRHHRGPDTASNVAHEVDDAGHHVALFLRDPDVGGQRDRDKQKPDADHLHGANPGRVPEVHEQPEMRRRVDHRQGHRQPAKGDQVARLDL